MKYIIAFIAVLLLTVSANAQSPVSVIGPITVGNCAQFSSNTVIKDAGVVCSGGGGGIVIGTTTVTGAGAGQFLFNNSGVVGAATLGTMSTQNANAVAITGGTITGLPSPSVTADAATKGYVDAVAIGLTIHTQVSWATTAVLPNTPTYANGTAGVGATLTAGGNAAIVVDGGNPVLNDRILVKNQAAGAQNGVYTVTTVGSGSVPWVLTRATDFNTATAGNMAQGAYFFVSEGSTNIASSWVFVTTGSITIGTTPLSFSQFSNGSGGPWAVSGSNVYYISGNVGIGTSSPANALSVVGSISTSAISGSIQCVQANSSGVLSGTGTRCGQGVSVTNFGAVCNNSTDDSAAIQSALNSGMKFVTLPGSNCLISSGITVPDSVTFEGLGYSSGINCAFASGNCVTLGTSTGATTIANMQVTSSVTRTSGAFIFSNFNVFIHDIICSFYFECIDVEGTSPSTASGPRIYNISTFLPVQAAGAYCIKWQYFASPVSHDIVCTGYGSGVSQPSSGFVIGDGDTFLGTNMHAVGHGIGWLIEPTSFAGAILITNCLGDSASNGPAGEINVPTGAAVTGVSFTNCSFSNTGSGEDGFEFVTAGSGLIDGVDFVSTIFENNGRDGAFIMNNNIKNIHFTGGGAAGNVRDGITFQGNGTGNNVMGMTIGPGYGRGGNGQYGINIVGGTSPCVIVTNNTLTGNIGGGIINAGSCSSTIISNNIP